MLTDAQCKKAKPGDMPYKLGDAGGLYLLVSPAGGRHWKLKYRFAGKEKKLPLGAYPEVSLSEARDKRDEARRLLRDDIDPGIERKRRTSEAIAAAEHTFEKVARTWYDINKSMWGERHGDDVIHSLERDVFPKLGKQPIHLITLPQVIDVLVEIENRPAIETAKRVRQRMSGVFVFSESKGWSTNDPAAKAKASLRPLRKGKQPAITDLTKARKILVDAEAEAAHAVTKLGLRLLALTAVRPGELRGAAWSEFEDLDGEAPLWRIPSARMKGKLDRKDEEGGDHLVPLSRQAVDVLTVAKRLSGRGPLAFPNARHSHKPMSENAIGYLLNRAGYHNRHVPHGWRSTFSTNMNERFKGDHAVIELMLAHVPQNKVKRAYDRAEHLERRRELAQIWADLIADGLPPAEELITGPKR